MSILASADSLRLFVGRLGRLFYLGFSYCSPHSRNVKRFTVFKIKVADGIIIPISTCHLISYSIDTIGKP